MDPLAELGRVDEALDMGNRAVDILTLDQDRVERYAVEIGIVYNNMGRIYLNRKHDLNAARLYILSATAIHVDQFGENHFTTAIDINNLGTVYRAEAKRFHVRGAFFGSRSKWIEAYDCFRKDVPIHKSLLVPSDYRLAVALFNLGAAAYSLERYSEAEPSLREAVEINDVLKGGATGWDQMDALHCLALTLLEIGKSKESLVYFDQALIVATSLYGDDAPVVEDIRMHRGAAAFDLGRHLLCSQA